MPELIIRCPICNGVCAIHGRFVECRVHGFFIGADLLTVIEY